MTRLVLAFVSIAIATGAFAAEVIPPVPALYFNDYAHVVAPGTANQLNSRLAQFERDTASQIVVAVFPKMETESSIEDYAQRIYDKWKIGQQKLSNGAILLVFVQNHKMRIHTGYGLEGALPDAICNRIIADEIAPHFKTGDYDGGLTAGVNAMIAAARGEYKGTGKTVHETQQAKHARNDSWIPFLIFIIIAILSSIRFRRGTVYDKRGGRPVHHWFIDFSSGGGGGSWGGGGGFSGGGSSDSFSSGGGSSGGGGASGDW